MVLVRSWENGRQRQRHVRVAYSHCPKLSLGCDNLVTAGVNTLEQWCSLGKKLRYTSWEILTVGGLLVENGGLETWDVFELSLSITSLQC